MKGTSLKDGECKIKGETIQDRTLMDADRGLVL